MYSKDSTAEVVGNRGQRRRAPRMDPLSSPLRGDDRKEERQKGGVTQEILTFALQESILARRGEETEN